MPKISPLPIDVLPESNFLRHYVEVMSNSSESPPQYHFGAILSGLSVILGRKVYYKLGSHTLYPNTYILVIGESGLTRKSSSVRPVIGVVRKINFNLVMPPSFSKESFIPTFNSYNTRFLFLDEVRMLFDLSNKNFGRGIISEITHLHECPREIRSSFVKDYDKDGDAKDTSSARDPFLSILALTTQDWMNMSENDIKGGFLGRFWTILSLGEEQKIVPFPEPNDQLLDDMQSLFLRLNKLRGVFRFHELTKPLWAEKYTSMMKEVRSHRSDQFSSFGTRLGDVLIKMCMLISSSMKVPSFDITPEVFHMACAFTDYLKESYLYLIQEMALDKFTRSEKRVESLLVKNGGIMGHSEIMNATRLNSKQLDEIVTNLRNRDVLEFTSTQNGKKFKKFYRLIKKSDF